MSANPAPTADLTVNLKVTEQVSANSGDFILATEEGTKTVTINANQSSATYTVPLNDDEVDEVSSALRVEVTSGTGYTVGSPDRSNSVTLLDDDPTTVTLTGTAEDIDEGTDKTITITLSRGLTGGERLTVPLTFGSSTAVRGTDYTLSGTSATEVAYTNLNSGNATVTFGSNTATMISATTATLTLSATADEADESGGETVDIGMGALVDNGSQRITIGGGSLDPADNLPTFRIKNTPSVTIAAGTSPITEGTAASFTVTAVPAPAANLPVSLTVADAPNADFVSSTNQGSGKTVTIPTSGTMTYTVATVGDDTDEPSGSVMVTLTNGSGYTVGSTSSATVTVNDDDPTTVTLAGPAGNIAAGGTKEFTITLNRGMESPETLIVPLTFEGTATRNTDYTVNCSDPVGATCNNLNTASIPQVTFLEGLDGAGARSITLTLTAKAGVEGTVDIGMGTLGSTNLGGGGMKQDNLAVFRINPPPAAPTGLTATAGDKQVTLSWTDPKNSDITGYQFRTRTDRQFGWANIVGSGATTTSYTVTRLTNGVVHVFQIRAVAGTVNSDPSDEVTVTPVAPEITIMAGTSPVTEGTAASFTITAVPAPEANLSISLTVADAPNADFVSGTNQGGKTVTIPTSGTMTYTVATVGDSNDEPSGSVMVALTNGSGYTVGSANSASVTVNDDDATIVTLTRTGSTGAISEGETVEFTVTLRRALIAGEIIDVPLIVSGTNITTADWSLARKTGNSLNTGITLANETTTTLVVRFSGVGAQTATLTLTTTVDNMAETGGSETLTLALGPDNSSANGFDLNTRMTNVGGGADPDATDNTFSVTINDVDNEAPMPSLLSLEAIDEQCELTKTQLDGMAPSATDNHPGTVTVTNNIGRFPITSDTTITWTYTDAAGNTATQTQQVTIDDTIDPVPMATDLPALEGCSQVTSLTAPVATDNCDGTITGTTTVTPPITASTTLTWTYRDIAGNAVTQMQEVVVNSDVLIPDVPSLPILTDQCRIAALSSPTAKNCVGNTITATTTATLPITANSTITWTYTDGGNTATQTQEVTISDTMNPVPDNTLSALTAAGSLAQTEVTVPTATDNCDGQIMAVPDVTFPITSDATITWTYTDAAGNTATQTQQVTITEAPLGAAEDVAEAVIFPNPSGRHLEVRSYVGGTFQLLSLSGKPLLEGTTNTRIDISSLQSGLYLVKLSDGRLLKFVRE